MLQAQFGKELGGWTTAARLQIRVEARSPAPNDQLGGHYGVLDDSSRMEQKQIRALRW